MTDEAVIRKDIKKWNINVCRRIRKGDKIVKHHNYGSHMGSRSLFWYNDLTTVPYKSKQCGLCQRYVIKHDNCDSCPLYRYQGKSCGTGKTTWDAFYQSPNLKTALDMRDTLVRVLRELS